MPRIGKAGEKDTNANYSDNRINITAQFCNDCNMTGINVAMELAIRRTAVIFITSFSECSFSILLAYTKWLMGWLRRDLEFKIKPTICSYRRAFLYFDPLK